MPLAKLQVAGTTVADKKSTVLREVSRILAQTTGKPEAVIMVTLEDDAEALMGGEPGPAAFIDIRGIGGLDREVNTQTTERLCALLWDELGIAPSRVYVTFTDVPAANWGWNGKTFG